MSMTKGQIDEFQAILTRTINKRILKVKQETGFDNAVAEAAVDIVPELLGLNIANLAVMADEAEQAVKDAEEAYKQAKADLTDAITKRIKALRAEGSTTAELWDALHKPSWYSSKSDGVFGTSRQGLGEFAQSVAKQRVAEDAEGRFNTLNELYRIHSNLDALLLMSTSTSRLSNMLRAFYGKLADENDQLAMEVITETFPFLFMDED